MLGSLPLPLVPSQEVVAEGQQYEIIFAIFFF